MDSSRFFVAAGPAVSLIKVNWQSRDHEVVATLGGIHSDPVTSLHYSAPLGTLVSGGADHLLCWTDLESFYNPDKTRSLRRQRDAGSSITAVQPHLSSKSMVPRFACFVCLFVCLFFNNHHAPLDWQTVFASTQNGQVFADDHRQQNLLPLIKEVRKKVGSA